MRCMLNPERHTHAARASVCVYAADALSLGVCVCFQLLALSINRGKLFRVSTVTSNRKWPKRQELYRNIVASFVPKGY